MNIMIMIRIKSGRQNRCEYGCVVEEARRTRHCRHSEKGEVLLRGVGTLR